VGHFDVLNFWRSPSYRIFLEEWLTVFSPLASCGGYSATTFIGAILSHEDLALVF